MVSTPCARLPHIPLEEQHGRIWHAHDLCDILCIQEEHWLRPAPEDAPTVSVGLSSPRRKSSPTTFFRGSVAIGHNYPLWLMPGRPAGFSRPPVYGNDPRCDIMPWL